MSWSAETMKALEKWLAPETSYKKHPIDDINFYIFIGYVWKDIHNFWDESMARDTIKRKIKELHPEWPPDLIEKVTEERKSDGTIILDFLCALKDENEFNRILSI